MAAHLRTIGILLFDGVEELDAVGPWEVLSFWARRSPEDGYQVVTLSQSGGPVACAKGLTVDAQHSYADVPALDVHVYPGGRGTRPQTCPARRGAKAPARAAPAVAGWEPAGCSSWRA